MSSAQQPWPSAALCAWPVQSSAQPSAALAANQPAQEVPHAPSSLLFHGGGGAVVADPGIAPA